MTREPLVHFFFLGAVLFAAHSLFVKDERTITVTPGVRDQLARSFEDGRGRAPSSDELEIELNAWQRDEALHREALGRGLDQDDANIRLILVGKMRALLTPSSAPVAPSEQQLRDWLRQHQSIYETPVRYNFEFVTFPKNEGDASALLQEFHEKVKAGAAPAQLGRPVLGAKLSAVEMKDRIEPVLAARLVEMAPGEWQLVETSKNLVMARVKGTLGGLAPFEELRPRLVVDWTADQQKKATDLAVVQIANKYRFQRQP